MKIRSFDKAKPKRRKDQEQLIDIFEKNIQYNNTIQLYRYFVPREYEMRLDLVSRKIYGSLDYMEELMVINNIISPYSIKENQLLYFCSIDDISSLYIKDDIEEEPNQNREKIIKAAQPSKKSTRKTPTTLQPANVKQVTIDTKNRKVKIMNSFK